MTIGYKYVTSKQTETSKAKDQCYASAFDLGWQQQKLRWVA